MCSQEQLSIFFGLHQKIFTGHFTFSLLLALSLSPLSPTTKSTPLPLSFTTTNLTFPRWILMKVYIRAFPIILVVWFLDLYRISTPDIDIVYTSVLYVPTSKKGQYYIVCSNNLKLVTQKNNIRRLRIHLVKISVSIIMFPEMKPLSGKKPLWKNRNLMHGVALVLHIICIHTFGRTRLIVIIKCSLKSRNSV